MALNVNREVTDSFYRYKMPRLVAKVEGKGNGIKTVIVNMVDIAKALNRPPMYSTKYFGIELGAQVNHEVKTDRYIVNGAHDANKLQELLDGFIKRFVLCASCSNPETDLRVRKERITAKCKACGHMYDIDATHKLCTFILREPPPSAAKSKDKTAEKDKTTEKDKKKDKNAKDVSKPEKIEKAEDKEKADANSGDEDPNWAGDEASIQAAQRARLAELGRAVRALALDEDAEKPEKERADKLHAFLSDLLAQRLASAAATGNKTIFDAEDEATIVAEAERLELGEKALVIIVEVLFSAAPSPQANGGSVPPQPNIAALAKRYASLLHRMTNGNGRAQSYLLGAFEILLSQAAHTQEQRLLPNLLMCLYEADVLEEDSVLEWYAHPRKFVSREQAAVLRRAAAPFVEWLEKAEEEDSDEEDDDDEENGKSQPSLPAVPASNGNGEKTPEAAEPEEDINIDEI